MALRLSRRVLQKRSQKPKLNIFFLSLCVVRLWRKNVCVCESNFVGEEENGEKEKERRLRRVLGLLRHNGFYGVYALI